MALVLPIITLLVGYTLLAWTLDRLTRFHLPRLHPSPRLIRIAPTAFLACMALYGVLRNVF
jgi:hypothetical protein